MQNLSKLADMLASASIFNSLIGIAVDVISLFMALLSFRGIDTQSLQARGEQRRSFYFNNDRDIIDIKIDEALWASSMLPEGIVERWFIAD